MVQYAYDIMDRVTNISWRTTGGATLGGFAYEYDALGRITSRSHSLGAPSHPSPMSQSSQKTYAYDAAGRLVREGTKTYRYGYLDKVLSVTDGKIKYTYTYHADGQLAKATVGGDHRAPRIPQQTEDFLWDGLALVKRGDEQFINEPHVGGGNPVVSSKGTSYFNDMLGTTLGAKAKGKKYSAAALTAFGESLPADTSNSQLPTHNSQTFYTGKPHVAGLGHAFLFRNYRAGLAKWQTADPMGYPDGWNQLAYCNNGVTSAVDVWGAYQVGDLRINDIFPNVLTEIASMGIEGYEPTYDLIGSDTEWKLNVVNAHKDWEWKPHDKHQDPVDVRGDKWDKLVWNYYDVVLTLTKETVLSKLAKYSGKIGDIGGAFGKVLRTSPLYDAAIEVAQFIGKIQQASQNEYSYRAGYIWRLDRIEVEWRNIRRIPFGCIE